MAPESIRADSRARLYNDSCKPLHKEKITSAWQALPSAIREESKGAEV